MKINYLILLLVVVCHLDSWAHIDPTKKPEITKNVTASNRADCRPGTNEIDMDVNNVRARLRTGGDVWWDGRIGLYVVPKPAEGQPAISSIFAGGVWVGGSDKSGNYKVAGVTYRDQNDDYDWYPGPLDLQGQTEEQICDDWDRFFSVNGTDIRNHIAAYDADPANFDCDSMADDIRYWPGRGNPFWNDKFTFDLPDQPLGAFWDENEDGIYNPCDGDFPTIEIRDCGAAFRTEAKELVPDQMVFWIYNDNGGPHRLSAGERIQMEVQVQSFAYATNDEINDMSFYRYKLINKAEADIIDCYFAMWVDPDLGCYSDDYIGCDVDRSLAYTYNEDALDGSVGVTCGGTNTYGANVPMIGTDYFRGPRGPKVFLRDADGNVVFGNEGNPILLEPEPGTGEVDTLVELGMTSFIYMNNAGIGSPPGPTTDPVNSDIQFYNNLRGLWKTGEPITRGGSGYDPTSTDTVRYVFPDDPNDPTGWSMCTSNLGFGDRRTLQATGPLLLQPGAINELIIGAVWVPDVDHPCPDISKIQNADDIAQALFDNCFDITDGPDAPDAYSVELDRQIIIALSNDNFSSNNKFLQYKERDLRTDNDTVFYTFEGYKIFQLADPSVTAQELSDVSKARLIYQSDVKNGVTEIFNWKAEDNPNAGFPNQPSLLWKATRMVAGQDQGLQATYNVLEDQFAKGDRRLVNHKQYHFMVLAYAHNNYLPFNPQTVLGQRTPYLEGRTNVKRYTFTPRPIVYDNLNSAYGEGVAITRLSGQGAGTNFLDISKETREKIIKGEITDGRITYLDGAGPLDIKIYNPLEVTDGKYQLDITGTFDNISSTCALKDDAVYTIKDLTTQEVIVSATSLKNLNEQLIYKKGFSVTVGQTVEPGVENGKGQRNGAINQVLAYENNSGSQWFNSVLDGDNGLVPVLGPLVAGLVDPIENSTAADPENVYGSGFGTNNFFPFALSRYLPAEDGAPYLTTTSPEAHTFAVGGALSTLRLRDLNNVDIVFTPNKDLWSRCVVVETATTYYTNFNESIDNINAMEVRKTPSVGKDGKPDDSGTKGFSYFPGYAIDVETGERLNIFFGENTIFRGDFLKYVTTSNIPLAKEDFCYDMIFNPSSKLIDFEEPLSDPAEIALNLVAGGMHNIYVTRQKYDGCAQLADRLKPGTSNANKRFPLGAITWTCMPLANNSFPMTTIENGLIPNELVVKLRVNSAYNKEKILTDVTKVNNCIVEDAFPSYEFEIRGKQAEEVTKDNYSKALANVNVVPNPYYAYSGYETSQFTNVVKITNLPPQAEITIYSLDGKFIRKYNRSENPSINSGSNPANNSAQEYPDLEWDMKNFQGIPVASGVYLIHVVADFGVNGKEERTLKWFGINRRFDPSGL